MDIAESMLRNMEGRLKRSNDQRAKKMQAACGKNTIFHISQST